MSAAESSKPSGSIPLYWSFSVTILMRIAEATWEVFLVASPYILLGLAAAGLLHVLIPAHKIARWLGRPGFGATARAACLGIPLPLCSCAVVPVTIELSRKGASREASLAFLVSTPETGVDSILITFGLMGPVMAVVRPLAALLTSLVAAASSMIWRDPPLSKPQPTSRTADAETGAETLAHAAAQPTRLRRAVRYGFIEMVDEIGFWLVTGLVLTGVITALVPEQLLRETLGQGPRAMLVLLVLGVPLYMCASASTPIAAALMLKGVSPGAALVFLLAGPATNASSLVVIARFFGRKFVAIYLSSVVITALLAGWGFDLLLHRTALTVESTLTTGGAEESSWLTLTSAGLLALLLLWSLARGSWRMAIREFVTDIKTWRRVFANQTAAPSPGVTTSAIGAEPDCECHTEENHDRSHQHP